MATMTNEQIEQKKSRLKQLTAEVNQIMKEAGAWPLDDEELDEVTGGTMRSPLLGLSGQKPIKKRHP